MSALLKTFKFAQIVNRNPAAVYSVVRNHWNMHFKPGPYPLTEAERVAAANKYNMLPEEYVPYADDGVNCTGDYPHLPDISDERKDPYYPYDFPELKRNFNEPIHADFDLYNETRFGTPAPLRYSYGFMLAVFSGVIAFLGGAYFYLDDKRMFRPVKPPQLPAPGVRHYTFEPKA